MIWQVQLGYFHPSLSPWSDQLMNRFQYLFGPSQNGAFDLWNRGIRTLFLADWCDQLICELIVFDCCSTEGNGKVVAWQPGDFEVTVRVYRPHKASQAMKTVYPSNDIWVHSLQTLAELKDVITCANNDILVGDIYSTTPAAEVMDVKNLVKSGVFLFGDTFYTDLRVVNNERYGEEIQKWMTNQPGSYQNESSS